MIETDLTAKSEQQTQLFLRKNAEILEMIATGQSASSIYDAIALMYEARHPGMRCSLLELKGNKLMHGGAPSLPKEYCDAVNGLENGPCVGSCGTSTYTGKRVLVENIETDPKWAVIKQAALPHGLRCCWSEPIKDSNGKVLGAFGMYYNHPALPNEDELSDLHSAARLAGIVMESDQREIALRQSENKYRTLVENMPQRLFLKDKNSVFVSCSNNLAEDLGITPEQIVGTTDYDYFPKEDAEHYRQDD
ncbi:MAG: GAF domain-containing protein [Candidatus Dadabacteria bacterium]|nr:GAF domain-containing protein [Candidatus Dadabacteria bacterium]